MYAIPHQRQRGYSLVEVSVVIGVLGVLGFAITSGLDNVQQFREHRTAVASTEAARNALRAFALRNKRLPCPDTSSDGSLGREPDGTCPRNAGWLPWETLGLPPPSGRARLKYGVYQTSTINLVAPVAPVSDGLDLEGNGRFLAALRQAVTTAPATSTPYYIQGGSDACSGTPMLNPAFVVIAPAADIGGQGQPFESFNANFGASSRCVNAPARRPDAGNDDIVLAESSTALLGWLLASTR